MTGGYGGGPEPAPSTGGGGSRGLTSDWGGTEWLEGPNDAAHAKYVERLNAWSDTEAFQVWSVAERDTAIADAQYLYATTSDAAEYWAAVPRLWETYATTFSSIEPAQFRKIVAAVAASSDAADTYETNRKITTFIEPPKIAKNIPWWVYGIGALVVFNAIRR
jgi:hypothetical protein